ncbi:hypothetical protein [Salinarimonas sp.]|uniref:hypothetical protein n=1 Tax=Salinarimonas sp. TaxID=2766526 RepID=UPI00391B9FF3
MPDTDRQMYVLYLRHEKSVEDFIYIIDFMRGKQMIKAKTEIYIRTMHESNIINFDRAKSQYIREFFEEDEDAEFKELVKAIKSEMMVDINTSFSVIQIGMEARDAKV